MSLQDFVIYDPQNQTRAYVRPYVGALRDYVVEREGETIAEFFNPKRGIIITNRPDDELGDMRAAYTTITSGEAKHDQLIDTDKDYRRAFTVFATCYHHLRCCAVPDFAIQAVFDFDEDMVAWIFDVLDEIYGEEKAYAQFHAPLPSCYAIGWQNFD
ncbi:hypothetical protein [Actinomyces sp.]|uniref:hypothetical protein n=1 Tax=Actinomyces sp. TaxID=29317 RepID=UPI002911D09D|nr:hypothetical protein [Actinomyces sp.]MDU5232383.1 hypothetical protein [Actinomyces sp.]